MFKRPLSSFVPSVYKGVVEMNDIINAEEQEFNIARREMSAAFANTFVLTSDESGVTMFEKMLNIMADMQTEDLEFRRSRVLNRLSMSPPFTFRFMKSRLDDIIGEGAWIGYIDFNNYTLYIESSATNQQWYHEVLFTVNRLKPCNLVFVNVPYSADTLRLSEEISYRKFFWKYKLGSWKLGQHPFATFQEGGVVKMPGARSIQSSLLSDTAKFVIDEIKSVLLNDTISVSHFSVKRADANIATLEYSVTPDMTNLITDIKLLKTDGTLLTQCAVYVPVTQPIISKHIITVKEGA